MKRAKNQTKGVITTRIEELLAARDMLPLHLANKTGIHNETIYRCLNGRRKWNLGHLELIAPVLGVTVGDLVQETVTVPVVGMVRDGQGPPQDQILQPELDQGSRPFRIKEDKETLAKMYDIEVEDRSMMPAFPPGTHLFAQRETSGTIKNENFVVYWGDDGQTYIRQIFFSPNQIILRSLTQGIPDKILPIKHLSLCDKIFRVEFPA